MTKWRVSPMAVVSRLKTYDVQDGGIIRVENKVPSQDSGFTIKSERTEFICHTGSWHDGGRDRSDPR